jgi:hypothetical protein
MKTTLNLVGPPVGDPQLPVQPLEMSALEELKEILFRLASKVQAFNIGIETVDQSRR